MCDVEYYKTAANAVKRAIADEANNVLDDYAQRVADADRAVDGLDFSFEGATRLRHLLSDATPTLEAVRDCVVAITAADAPRGGRLVDFCRDRAQRSGAPQVAHALRRLTAAAEKAVLRACCAWCVRGALCRYKDAARVGSASDGADGLESFDGCRRLLRGAVVVS